MRVPPLLTMVVLMGCHHSEVTALATDLQLPSTVDCGQAAAGEARPCRVTAINGSRASRSFTLTYTGDFAGPPDAELGVGATVLEFEFRPRTLGPLTGSITLSEFVVALTGTGLEVRPCRSQSSCREAIRDPETGACVERPLENGAACASNEQCVVAGSCLDGRCVGEARRCDDANRCTTDACDPTSGCTHQPSTCARSSNPCEVGVCDPALGCRQQPVLDGTTCGSNDCSTAHVCISGSCVERAAPEGSECAPATACSHPRTCQRQRCTATGPRPLTERWRFTPPPGRAVQQFMQSVTGRIYATVAEREGSAPPLTLMALDPRGAVEFSVDLTAEDPTTRSASRILEDLTAGRVCLITIHENQRISRLSCRDSSTGRLLWRRTMSELGVPGRPVEQLVMSLAATGAGNLVMLVMQGAAYHELHVIEVDGATGMARWRRQEQGHGRLWVSQRGDVWLRRYECSGPPFTLVRLSSSGRWQTEGSSDTTVLGFADDTILVARGGTYFDAISGPTAMTRRVPTAGKPTSALWENGSLTTLTSMTSAASPSWLVTRTTLDGGVQWSMPVHDTWVFLSQLLADGGVAVTSSNAQGRRAFELYSSTGEKLERCELDNLDPPSIAAERGVSRSFDGALVGFDFPRLHAAPGGWSTPTGFNGTLRAK